jgi:hypothetical protein
MTADGLPSFDELRRRVVSDLVDIDMRLSQPPGRRVRMLRALRRGGRALVRRGQ